MGIECKPSAGKSKLSPKIYDLVIIGGGPAGMGAAIYASRYKINGMVFKNVIQMKEILAKDYRIVLD